MRNRCTYLQVTGKKKTMTLEKIIEELDEKESIHISSKKIFKQTIELSKKKKEFLIKNIAKEIQTIFLAKGNAKSIIQLLTIGFCVDKTYFFKSLKRIGVLRYSNYIELTKSPIKFYCNHILQLSKIVQLEDHVKDYLQSLIVFELAFRRQIYFHKEITKKLFAINKRHKNKSIPLSFIKTLLGYSELIYNTKGSIKKKNDLDSFSRELILEGTSYLVSRWNSLFGLSERDLLNPIIGTEIINSINTLLLLSIKLRLLKEAEINIESLGYQCIKDEKSNIYFKHPDLRFWKSGDLNAILNQSQGNSDFLKLKANLPHLTTNNDIYEYIFKSFPDTLSIKYHPEKRYVLKIAEPLLEYIFSKDTTPTFEEIANLNSLSKELLFVGNQMEEFHLKDKLTVIEFIRLSRLFGMLYNLISKKIVASEKDQTVLFNALCFIIGEEEFYSYFDYSKATSENIDSFIDLITWDADGGDFLDIQYTPLLYIDGRFVVLHGIIHFSNLVRNLFITQAKKGNNLNQKKTANYNSLVNKFVEVLDSFGFTTLIEQKISFKTEKKTESDIDILAIKDGNIFIFECKDSIFSVTPFEKRTIFNAFSKASSQLEYAHSALKDSDFLRVFNQTHNLSIKPNDNLYGVILTTNRIFWGLHINDYPVRSINELISLFETGKWIAGTLEKREEVKIWNNQKFEVQDLIEFIDKEDCPHNTLYDSMYPTEYELDEKIFITKFGLNIEEQIERLKEK